MLQPGTLAQGGQPQTLCNPSGSCNPCVAQPLPRCIRIESNEKVDVLVKEYREEQNLLEELWVEEMEESDEEWWSDIGASGVALIATVTAQYTLTLC